MQHENPIMTHVKRECPCKILTNKCTYSNHNDKPNQAIFFICNKWPLSYRRIHSTQNFSNHLGPICTHNLVTGYVTAGNKWQKTWSDNNRWYDYTEETI